MTMAATRSRTTTPAHTGQEERPLWLLRPPRSVDPIPPARTAPTVPSGWAPPTMSVTVPVSARTEADRGAVRRPGSAPPPPPLLPVAPAASSPLAERRAFFVVGLVGPQWTAGGCLPGAVHAGSVGSVDVVPSWAVVAGDWAMDPLPLFLFELSLDVWCGAAVDVSPRRGGGELVEAPRALLGEGAPALGSDNGASTLSAPSDGEGPTVVVMGTSGKTAAGDSGAIEGGEDTGGGGGVENGRGGAVDGAVGRGADVVGTDVVGADDVDGAVVVGGAVVAGGGALVVVGAAVVGGAVVAGGGALVVGGAAVVGGAVVAGGGALVVGGAAVVDGAAMIVAGAEVGGGGTGAGWAVVDAVGEGACPRPLPPHCPGPLPLADWQEVSREARFAEAGEATPRTRMATAGTAAAAARIDRITDATYPFRHSFDHCDPESRSVTGDCCRPEIAQRTLDGEPMSGDRPAARVGGPGRRRPRWGENKPGTGWVLAGTPPCPALTRQPTSSSGAWRSRRSLG